MATPRKSKSKPTQPDHPPEDPREAAARARKELVDRREKALAGRPTKYQAKYAAGLIEHMEKGGSFESYAAVIGVHRDTLYEWEKAHEEFSDAKKMGKDAALLFFENMARSGMAGNLKRVTKIKRKPDGTTQEVYALAPFNATSWIFTMLNRFPEQYRNRQELIHRQGAPDDDIPRKTPDEIRAELDAIGGRTQQSKPKV